jgi:hypothetical protein
MAPVARWCASAGGEAPGAWSRESGGAEQSADADVSAAAGAHLEPVAEQHERFVSHRHAPATAAPTYEREQQPGPHLS